MHIILGFVYICNDFTKFAALLSQSTPTRYLHCYFTKSAVLPSGLFPFQSQHSAELISAHLFTFNSNHPLCPPLLSPARRLDPQIQAWTSSLSDENSIGSPRPAIFDISCGNTLLRDCSRSGQ